MIVPLMLLSDEGTWLESEIRALTSERIRWQVLEAGLRTIPVDGVLAIVVESGRHPRLNKLLRAALARLGDDRCALLFWADGRTPDLRGLRGWMPKAVIYLPDEVERLLAWAQGTRIPMVLDDLTEHLRPDLPAALRLALWLALGRSGDPSGEPPPRTVAELARASKVDRANLHRRAEVYGVDLGGLLQYKGARWVLARYRAPEDVAAVLRAMGWADERPLRRLLSATVGHTLGRACGIDPDRMVRPILNALGEAAKVSQTGQADC